MYPNDADGNAIRAGFGPPLKKAGYTIVDPGAYRTAPTTTRRRSRSSRQQNCQIFNTFPIPPDFATFWRQAAQQGYQAVKIAQIAKTGLFPSQVEALGSTRLQPGERRVLDPTCPYKSSLTGHQSQAARRRLQKATRQAVEPAARRRASALFDVGAAALKATRQPEGQGRRSPTRSQTLKVDTPVGHLDWAQGAGAERRRRRRSSAASGSRRRRSKFKLELRHLRALRRPERAGGGQAEALQLTLAGQHERRGRRRTPILAAVGRPQALRRARRPRRRRLRGRAPARPSASSAPTAPARRRCSNVLAGSLRADARHASRFAARDVTRLAPAARCRLGIGRAHQIPRPFGGMTVFENVLRRRGARAAGCAARAAYDRVHRGARARAACSTLANRRAESLGLLDRKRLELARALATDPAVLLLDEIGGGLTDAEAAELVATIQRAARARASRSSGSSTSCTCSCRSSSGSSAWTPAASSPTASPTR